RLDLPAEEHRLARARLRGAARRATPAAPRDPALRPRPAREDPGGLRAAGRLRLGLAGSTGLAALADRPIRLVRRLALAAGSGLAAGVRRLRARRTRHGVGGRGRGRAPAQPV